MEERTAERRRRTLRATQTVGVAALGTQLVASALLAFDLRAVVVATLATAVLAGSAFIAAYEGFDERLRRRP